jgi:hypothetical protein
MFLDGSGRVKDRRLWTLLEFDAFLGWTVETCGGADKGRERHTAGFGDDNVAANDKTNRKS